MTGLLSRWILSRVVRSAITFEAEAVDSSRGLRERMQKTPGACRDDLESSVCHILEEDEAHRALLARVAAGQLSTEELDRVIAGHTYPGIDALRPLEDEERASWAADLEAALEHEEKTWIFYGNLRRMSKIPAVKRAFEVLAAMEQEHVVILRRLLGKGNP
jgi:rubrerythrin